MAENGISLFGFEIKRKGQEKEDAKKQSFVAPQDADGSSYVQAGGYFGQYLDTEGVTDQASEGDLIRRYREIAMHPECDAAIEDIINEAIVSDSDSAPVDIILDDLDQPDTIKDQIKEEFDNIISLLQFNNYGHEIFRKWYVDGRVYYHILVDEKQPKRGIIELRPIDATRMTKVKQLNQEKDEKTGVTLIKDVEEYYMYRDAGLAKTNQGIKISKDAIQ